MMQNYVHGIARMYSSGWHGLPAAPEIKRRDLATVVVAVKLVQSSHNGYKKVLFAEAVRTG
jgi:hypothetical protein